MDYETTVTHDTDYELDAEWDWYWKSVGEREWEDAQALNETIGRYGVTLGDVQGSSQGYYLGSSRAFDLDDTDPEAMRDRLDELLVALGREFPIGLLAEDPHAYLLSCLDAGDIAKYRASLDASDLAYRRIDEASENGEEYDGPDWAGLLDFDAMGRLEVQLTRGLLGWMNDLQWHIDVLSPDASDDYWHDRAVERLVADGLDKETAEAAFADWMRRH